MKKGFTIVELLVVIVVIAILAAIVTVAYNGVKNNTTESSIKSDLRNTATKVNLAKVEQSGYPLTLSASDKIESANSLISYTSDGETFCLGVTTKTPGGPSFFMTQTGVVQSGACPVPQVVWTQVSAGVNHVLGLASNGKVYAWGGNANGQLGIGSSVQQLTPTEITSGALAGKTITQLSAGDAFSLALASDGTVYSWGNNTNGQLGVATGSRNTPIAVTGFGGKAIAQIKAGGVHALALATDGTLFSWGYNASGQLGDTSTATRTTPVAVAGIVTGKTIVQMSAGYHHSVAVGSTGAVYVWGYNNYGQLGIGSVDTTAHATPVAASAGCLSGKTIVKIATGYYHGIATANDGSSCGWGYNTYGQLGIGSTATPQSTPVVAGAIAGKTVGTIESDSMHNLAITTDGMLYVWGRNSVNQLGDGLTANRTSAFSLSNAAPLIGKVLSKASAGTNYSFALADDGTLYGWGDNSYGQMGNNSTTQQPIPLALPTPQ